jgi:hypothetical protein
MRLVIIFTLITFFLALNSVLRFDNAYQPEQEGDRYLGWASALVLEGEYRGCPTIGYFMCEDGTQRAYRLPVYPMLLAGALTLVGTEYPLIPLRLLQAMGAALLTGVLVGLAYRLSGSIAALATGLFVVFTPNLYLNALFLYTELTFTLLLAVLLTRMVRVWAS